MPPPAVTQLKCHCWLLLSHPPQQALRGRLPMLEPWGTGSVHPVPGRDRVSAAGCVAEETGATPRAAAAAALRPSRWAPRASSPSRFNAKGDSEGQKGLSHACPEVGRCQTLGKPKHFASPTDGVTPEPIPALEQTASMSTPKSQAAPVIQGWGRGEHQAAPLCQAEGVGFCITATQAPELARKIPVLYHGNWPGAPGEGAALMGAAGRGDGTRWMGSALTNCSSRC